MATIGTLSYKIIANTSSFTKGMVATRKELRLGNQMMEQAKPKFARYNDALNKLNILHRKGAIDARAMAMGQRMIAREALNSIPIMGQLNGLLRIYGRLLAAAAIIGFAKRTESFNAAMLNSQAIMGDLTETMKKDMVDAANAVSFSTKFAAKEAAEAYFFLASAGLSAEQSIAALPQVAKFAQAGVFDLALATDLATDALTSLGLESKDAQENLENLTRVTDVLVGANTIANASAQQFSEALTNKAGAALRLLNKDIEEGVAVLSVFADQSRKGAEAGTALDIVLRDLQSKNILFRKEWDKLNIKVFDVNENMRNMADIVQDLERELLPMSPELRRVTLMTLGFSEKSVSATNMLLGFSEKIRENEKRLRAMGGITEEVASKQLTKFRQALNRVRAILDRAAQAIFTPLLEGFGAMVIWVTDTFQGMNGPLAKVILQIGVFAAGFILAVAIIPKVIAVIRLLIIALKQQVLAQIAALAVSGPKGWAILATAAGVGAGAVLLANKAFKGFEKTVRDSEKEGKKLAKTTEDLSKKVDGLTVANKSAAESAEKAAEEQRKFVNSIAEAAETPLDKYRIKMLKIVKVRDVLTDETFRRSVEKYGDDLASALSVPLDSLDTPFEKFRKKIASIDTLTKENIINNAQRLRALKAARDELESALDVSRGELKNPELIEANTQGAFKAEFGEFTKGLDDLADVAREHKDIAEEELSTLRSIERELTGSGPKTRTLTLKKTRWS